MAVPMHPRDEETALADLATRVITEVRSALRQPAVDEIRTALNESGIRRARKALADAPDILDAAQREFRVVQEAERDARRAYEDAVLEAEWSLDARFVNEANKWFLVTACNEHKPGEGERCNECNGTDKTRQQMTAEERAKWKTHAARSVPEVKRTAEALRRAEERVATARDGVTLADKKLSACKADVDAAIAELGALSLALQAKGA